MKLGIIGFGNIGRELFKRALARDWKVVVARTSGMYNAKGEKIDEPSNWFEYFKNTDITCLCIPTYDDGKTAYQYIKKLVENGQLVVTCEKGALGNYFSELEPWIDKIGYSATVGGGTGLLNWLKEKLSSEMKIEEIHLIINGTLNFIFHLLSTGVTIEEAVSAAKKFGYVEPGAVEPIDIINTEAGKDVPLKTSILLNACNFCRIRARDIYPLRISEGEIEELVGPAGLKENRRYVISITKELPEEDAIGGFYLRISKEWHVLAGFKDIEENPFVSQLAKAARGVGNGVLINSPDGAYFLVGPGAGAVPTVNAILRDIEKLLKIKKRD